MKIKYKLNQKHVDLDEPGKLILNLPKGYRFDFDQWDVNHIWAFESEKEMRDAIRDGYVVQCDCKHCSK